MLEEEGLIYGRQGSGSFVRDPAEEEAGKSRRIAVVTTYVDNYIFPKIIQGIEQVLSREDFQVQIAFTNNRIQKETEILESLLSRICAASSLRRRRAPFPTPISTCMKSFWKRAYRYCS